MSKEKLIELQQQFLNNEFPKGSEQDRERRRLFFDHAFEDITVYIDGDPYPLLSNMKPCLEDCNHCGKPAYLKYNDETKDYDAVPGGHTGWGVIGTHHLMRKDNSGYHFNFCSEECWNTYQSRENNEWSKLLNRKYSDFSDEMDLPEFEDFTIWYANGFLKECTEDVMNNIKNSNPLLMHPRYLAAHLRQGMMPHMSEYVKYVNEGFTISRSGAYSFIKPIPKEEAVRILKM